MLRRLNRPVTASRCFSIVVVFPSQDEPGAMGAEFECFRRRELRAMAYGVQTRTANQVMPVASKTLAVAGSARGHRIQPKTFDQKKWKAVTTIV